METEAGNTVLLGHIRHWDNLKAAIDNNTLWVKDITPEQADSIELQSIPYKQLYYLKDNLLFLKDSLLPTKKITTALLWSPLIRLLPVTLPALNHNFFGINSKVAIKIVPAITEQQPFALLTTIKNAKQYIETAPQVRLQKILWIGINNNVLLLGTPLLPVKGQTYWQVHNMLLPAGFDFEFPVLYQTVQKMIDATGENTIVWQQDGSYILLNTKNIRPLSISSFRLTYSVII